jgi:GTPase SAR1 family protein
MRIAICGTANMGKSTLINDFIKAFPTYEADIETYRKKIVDEELPHSKETNKDTQWKVLNHMIDRLQSYSKDDHVIFDRCPLDNLVYSLWSLEKGASDIDDDFISKCLPLVRESMSHLDIIFFLPISKYNKMTIESDGMRETDTKYIAEIDAFFKVIQRHYNENPQENPFFPRDDMPGFIEIFGNREERIAMIKLYVDVEGDLIGGNDEDLANLLAQSAGGVGLDETTNAMENLIKAQKEADKTEKEVKVQLQDIKNFLKDGGKI